MNEMQKEIVAISMDYILPHVQKNTDTYRDFSKFILEELEGEHECCILWNRNENFVSLLSKHNIPIEAIDMKEVTIGCYYVRVRDNYYHVKEKILFNAVTA